MAKKLGNEYRLWIETAVADTYGEIKGQTSMKVNRQAGNIDTSSKEDFPYGTASPGARAITIDVELFPNLPDVNYTRLETKSQASPQEPVKFQIRKNGSAGSDSDDVVFESLLNIGNFDTDFPMNGVVKNTMQLTLAEKPTIDALG